MMKEHRTTLQQAPTDDLRDSADTRDLLSAATGFLQPGNQWFWATDAEGVFVPLSGIPADYPQSPPAEYIGKSRTDLMTNDVLDVRGVSAIQNAMNKKQAFTNIRVEQRLAGQVPRRILVSGTPIWSDAGEFLGYRGAETDVSSTVTDETSTDSDLASLRKSEAQYRFLIEHSIQAIVVHRDLKILYANQAFADLIGADTADELFGKSLENFHVPDEVVRLERFRQLRLNGKKAPAHYETRYRRLDGKPIWAEQRVKMINFNGDEAILVSALDITKRRRQEQALLRSKLEAETANRAKTQFLANMSHELRTPLNAVLGFTEVMRNEMFGPVENNRYAEYLGDISGSATHLLDLINDILDVSQIEAGRRDLDETAFCIDKILEDAVRRSQALEIEVNIVLALDPALSEIRLLGDRRSIVQIVDNLLSNALKFTDADGTVTVGCTLVEDQIRLYISDTGRGIPSEHIERILEPFEQVRDVTAPQNSGVGLGLSIVRALVDMHDAIMQIESKVDEGTTISVLFPASRVKTRSEIES